MFLLTKMDLTGSLTAMTGFGFGASVVALFARVGGGIYTKAADVGADLLENWKPAFRKMIPATRP